MCQLIGSVISAGTTQAIVGAQIKGRVSCNPWGGGIISGSTDTNGRFSIDTGCSAGGGSYTIAVTAQGYTSVVKSGNLASPYGPMFCGDTDIGTVALNEFSTGCTSNSDCPVGSICENGNCVDVTPGSCGEYEPCTNGYDCVQGHCVQVSTTIKQSSIIKWLHRYWWVLIILFIGIGLVAILKKRSSNHSNNLLFKLIGLGR